MNNSSTAAQLKPLWNFLHRYHVVLFVIVALGSLSVATFFLSRTIAQSSEVTTVTTDTGFDDATIKKIESLKSIDEQENSSASAPRSTRNPFTE